MPLQSNTINATSAIANIVLVRIRNATSARHGGILARADFHVTPPFGSSIIFVESSIMGSLPNTDVFQAPKAPLERL